MKRALAILLVLTGCAAPRVDPVTVKALPLEQRLDLLEAENELFAAMDAVDEATCALQDARDEYRSSGKRIVEAEAALDQAKDRKEPRQIEIAKLSLKEAEQRKDVLDESRGVEAARLALARARLDLAQARFERTKALAVKRGNVEGSQKLDLADFEEAIADQEKAVRKVEADAAAEEQAVSKVRAQWTETRKALAAKTGGGEGSPWVQ